MGGAGRGECGQAGGATAPAHSALRPRTPPQAGCDLVPVYHLGSSQVLSFSGASELSRRMRLSVACYWGSWGLPLPRPHPIISLVGRPVPVAQCDDPSQAEVDALHARFTAALTALFDEHKHLLGPEWEAKALEVV